MNYTQSSIYVLIQRYTLIYFGSKLKKKRMALKNSHRVSIKISSNKKINQNISHMH